jgi:excisionase family DNA binding protein
VAEHELTTTQVAELLGVHPTTVLRIPADRLRFRTTPGRHRIYLRDDVDRYQSGLAPEPAAAPTHEDRIGALEADVADLKAWRSRLEGDR